MKRDNEAMRREGLEPKDLGSEINDEDKERWQQWFEDASAVSKNAKELVPELQGRGTLHILLGQMSARILFLLGEAAGHAIERDKYQRHYKYARKTSLD